VVVTNYLWRPRLADIVAAVAPGGVLLYETFAAGQRNSGQALAPDFLLQPGELLRRLRRDLRVVAYEDGFLAEPARFVQRIAAVRPGNAAPASPPAIPCGKLRAAGRVSGCAGVSRIGAFVHRQRDSPLEQLTGSIVALVTPMHDDGSVDYPALRKLIDWHIDEGTDCLGVVGTTGESPTVDVEEHCEIIRVSVEQAKGRVPVMAGCGANSTKEAIELAKFAKGVGADSQLQVVPYYNKPTQEGQYRHFKAIAEAVGDLPTCCTTCPAAPWPIWRTTPCCAWPQVPGIIGIKEATGNIERAQWLIRDLPKNFAVYSGDDPTAVALMLCGGQGNISVTANVAPRKMHELCVAALAGDVRARWKSSSS
jgi:4-hydroxy-tetrahydrodipicolinate synthase